MEGKESAAKMKYVRLGNTGLKVSRVCLGMMSYGDKQYRKWVLEEEEALPHVKRALDMGINFFDTANAYCNGHSERILGKAMKLYAKRDEVVIATKCYFPANFQFGTPPKPNCHGLSRKNIFASLEASLERLQMDYVDLFQIHRWDNDTPIEETMEALHDLVKSGKVRYIGASSMFAWQFQKAQWVAEKNGWTKFVSMQNHYNLLYREEEREMIPCCVDGGIGIIPWSPLARGYLAGTRERKTQEEADKVIKEAMAAAKGASPDKKNKGEDESSNSREDTDKFAVHLYLNHPTVDTMFDIIDRVKEIAEKHEKSAAQIALAWMYSKRYITAPIVGSTKIEHIEQAVEALSITLSPEDVKYLEEPYRPRGINGHSLSGSLNDDIAAHMAAILARCK